MKMYKITKMCILLLVVICAVNGLIGCHIKHNIIGISDYYYDNSEKYSIGDTELTETVENIEISWMVGNVKILTHNSNTVSLSENSQKELTEEKKLHYWLDNATLYIKFCGVGKWDFSELDKELTLLVPQTLILKDLRVNSLSANVKLTDCAVSELVKINTVSGEFDAKFSKDLKAFNGNSTSGSFKVEAPSVSRVDVDAVSGAVSLTVQKEPDSLDFDATSGNITLNLPKSASFELYYDTTSGDLYSDLTYEGSSKKYVFGDGKGEYEIETVSGDVRITSNK